MKIRARWMAVVGSMAWALGGCSAEPEPREPQEPTETRRAPIDAEDGAASEPAPADGDETAGYGDADGDPEGYADGDPEGYADGDPEGYADGGGVDGYPGAFTDEPPATTGPGFMDPCDPNASPDECTAVDPDTFCFRYNMGQSLCTKSCSSDADCPAPSTGCNGMGVCRRPNGV